MRKTPEKVAPAVSTKVANKQNNEIISLKIRTVSFLQRLKLNFANPITFWAIRKESQLFKETTR